MHGFYSNNAALLIFPYTPLYVQRQSFQQRNDNGKFYSSICTSLFVSEHKLYSRFLGKYFVDCHTFDGWINRFSRGTFFNVQQLICEKYNPRKELVSVIAL